MVKTNMIGFIWHIILYMKSSNMIHSIVQTKVDRGQLFATLSQTPARKKGALRGPTWRPFIGFPPVDGTVQRGRLMKSKLNWFVGKMFLYKIDRGHSWAYISYGNASEASSAHIIIHWLPIDLIDLHKQILGLQWDPLNLFWGVKSLPKTDLTWHVAVPWQHSPESWWDVNLTSSNHERR